MSAGPPDELTQALNFVVGNDNNALFSVQPTIDPSCTLTYTPAPNANGTTTVSVALRDNGGTANGGVDTSATQTFTITVTAVNDAPVLNNSGSPQLASIPQAPSSNPGTLVSDIIASMSPLGSITDVDAGALQGIAVIGVDSSNGVWQYSTNGGANWTPFGDLSVNARLLAADAGTRIQFLPNVSFSGLVPSGITLRAWDRSSGNNGDVVPISQTGGTTPFSVATETASINVLANTFAVRAGQGGTNPDDEGRSVVVSPSGDVFVAGTLFYADGVSDSTSAKHGDIFVARYAANGTLVWQQIIGSTGDDRGLAIARDSQDNIYITGAFHGTVDFDVSSATHSLTSAGGFDAFVLKLDANGAFQWVHGYGGPASAADIGNGIAVDSVGNVLVTGQFAGTVDFNVGGTATNLTSAGSDDVFVLKLSNSGALQWVQSVGASGLDRGTAITTDSTNRVYVTGSFAGSPDFDPGTAVTTLTSSGKTDIFVLRLNADGTFSSAAKIGGSGADEGEAIALDSAGDVYTTGFFSGTADFDPSAAVSNLVSAGGVDAYVSKLSPTFASLFAARMGGSGDDRGRGLAVLSDGSLAVTGHFTGTADFDPGTGVFNLVSGGSNDIFVSRLSSTGTFVAAQRLGGSSTDMGRAIAVDVSNNLYLTGQFSGTVAFDTGAGVVNLTSSGGKDIYVVKMLPPQGATPMASVALASIPTASVQTSNLDVTGNGVVSPADLLAVINWLNSHPADQAVPAASARYDVNRDGRVTPLDALTIINALLDSSSTTSSLASGFFASGAASSVFALGLNSPPTQNFWQIDARAADSVHAVSGAGLAPDLLTPPAAGHFDATSSAMDSAFEDLADEDYHDDLSVGNLRSPRAGR
ncbi:MAG: SBBP repeat-containing protein [Planctomycetia bacterium]|nr:SBBP repeat-containing protein [Planctomycetia bacterium]